MASIGVVDTGAITRTGLASLIVAAGHDVYEAVEVGQLPCVLDGAIIAIRLPKVIDSIAALASEHPTMPIIALLFDSHPANYAEALRAGATSAVGWEASDIDIATAIASALEGRALLPAYVAQSLARGSQDLQALADEEVLWIRHLARGMTIAELAMTAGYSERSMYRLLASLYERLGVRNRSEAIVAASRRQIL